MIEEREQRQIPPAPPLLLTLTGQSGQGRATPQKEPIKLRELLTYHSSLGKVLRVTAYVLRFIRLMKQSSLEKGKQPMVNAAKRKRKPGREVSKEKPAKRV